MGMERYRTKLPNAILPRIRVSLLSFLTHYLLYLDFLTSDDLCITAYCDNYRMINNNYVDRLFLLVGIPQFDTGGSSRYQIQSKRCDHT
jgi:hypothetical protein